MKFFVLLLSVVGLLALPLVSLGASEADHYEFDLTADPDQATLKGHVALTVDPARYPGGKLYLRLPLNQETEKNPKLYGPLQDLGADPEPVGQAISNLTVGGQPAPVRFAPDAAPTNLAVNLEKLLVAVDLPTGSAPVEIAFDYEVRLHQRLGMDDYASGPRFFSRFSWFPGAVGDDDRNQVSARLFTYKAKVAFPADWDLVKTGTQFASASRGHFELASTTPVHSLPLLAVQGFGTLQRTLADGRLLTMYFEKDAESRARLLLTYAQEALDAYAQRYFSLDLTYVSMVQGTPGFYGMAADGAVILGNGMYRPADFLTPGLMDRLAEYVVAHELGHFYFGIGVGQDFLTDNYLSEGLNDSSTLLYLEKKYGRWDNLFLPTKDWVQQSLGDGLSENLGVSFRTRKEQTVLATHRLGWDDALNNASVRDVKLNGKASTDYDRPTFVFGMLAATLGLGPDDFADVLAETARAWYRKTLDTRRFQAFLEERYKVSLDAFFKAYVTSPGWIDYTLDGSVNHEAGSGAWRHEFEVGNAQPGPFVPTTLTLKLANGTTERRPVPAAGPLSVETKGKILWAAVDFDMDALDFDRKNNFAPPPLLVSPDDKDRPLVNSHLDTLTPFDAQVSTAGQTLDITLGPSLTDGVNYQAAAGPVLHYDLKARSVEAGAAALAAFSLPGSTTWDLAGRVLTSGRQSMSAGWSQAILLPADYGQTGRYDAQAFSLAARVAGDLKAGRPETGTADQSATWTNWEGSGSSASLGHAVVFHAAKGGAEGRVSADWEQVFPSFPGTFLGAGASSSAGWGKLIDLGTRAEAFGFAPGGPRDRRFDFAGQLFFGLPLADGLGRGTGNTFVLQNLQAALLYRWSTAFDGGADFAARPQNSLAVALLPGLLTIGDSPIQGLALGVSLDLNAVASHPEAGSSWVPRFFLEVSPFTAILAQLSSW